MGIFDYVAFEMDCPTCGEKMKGFQTKDGDVYMKTVNWWEVNNFYDYCEKCGTWVEFHRKQRTLDREKLLDYFDMSIEKEKVRRHD